MLIYFHLPGHAAKKKGENNVSPFFIQVGY